MGRTYKESKAYTRNANSNAGTMNRGFGLDDGRSPVDKMWKVHDIKNPLGSYEQESLRGQAQVDTTMKTEV
jgi:hypothetical protein